jgi:hypothetical protein
MLSLASLCRKLSSFGEVDVHFHSKFIQFGWWVEIRLNIGLFEHKMPLGFISIIGAKGK